MLINIDFVYLIIVVINKGMLGGFVYKQIYIYNYIYFL